MNQISSNTSPLIKIKKCIKSENDSTRSRFIGALNHLYQFEDLKLLLDTAMTVALQGRLSFIVQDKRIFELDEGNCKTIASPSLNNLFNYVRTNNNYVITIKKPEHHIIVHEIAHMVEKEFELDLKGFVGAMKQDIDHGTYALTIKEAISSHITKPLEGYSSDAIDSEMFARFYHIHTLAQEIVGKFRKTGYNLNMLKKAFALTHKWTNVHLLPKAKNFIDPIIAKYSKGNLIKTQVKHIWRDNHIGSFHKSRGQNKWRSSFKSIKNNPFKN